MKDGIIKNTGNSRMIRASLPASYEEFRRLAAAGQLPIDLLFNAAGWQQQPDFLNKATLLTDATGALFGKGPETVPDEIFSDIFTRTENSRITLLEKLKIVQGTFKGPGKGSSKVMTEGNPQLLFINESASADAPWAYIRPWKKSIYSLNPSYPDDDPFITEWRDDGFTFRGYNSSAMFKYVAICL